MEKSARGMRSSNWTKCQISEHKWILLLLPTENMQKQKERPGVNMGYKSLFAKTISARKMKMYVEGIVDESQGIP